jgi:hypothetical protein
MPRISRRVETKTMEGTKNAEPNNAEPESQEGLKLRNASALYAERRRAARISRRVETPTPLRRSSPLE